MGYSRRVRFMDGKSTLHRVEFAREFETRLAAGHHRPAAADEASDQTVATEPGAAGPDAPEERHERVVELPPRAEKDPETGPQRRPML